MGKNRAAAVAAAPVGINCYAATLFSNSPDNYFNSTMVRLKARK